MIASKTIKAQNASQQVARFQLLPDETLLAYTAGKLCNSAGPYYRKEVVVGLTSSRLLLTLLDLDDLFPRTFSFSRQNIEKMAFDRSYLKIRINNEDIAIHCRGLWQKQAQKLIVTDERAPVEPGAYRHAPGSRDALLAAQDLYDLGAPVAAQKELKKAVQAYPFLEVDPQLQEMRSAIFEFRIALVTGAVFLVGALAAIFGLASLRAGRINELNLILELAIVTVTLVAGKNFSRDHIIYLSAVLAGVEAVFPLIYNGASASNLINLFMWLSFLAAILVNFLGRPERLRTLLAAVIYIIGFLGAAALYLLVHAGYVHL